MKAALVLCLALGCAAAQASEPPRVRLARCLSGDQIARIVTNAPPGAKISVPFAGMREWAAGQSYAPGDVASKGGAIYVCNQGHKAQSDWAPAVVPALWRLVRAQGEAPSDIPAWRQPYGAHDAYAKGAKVKHSGKTWESSIANNVWAPGVYGWKTVN